MKYRAKVTAIQFWVGDHYNTSEYHLVRDAKDVYLEVDSEDEAEALEKLNKAREECRRLKLEIITNYLPK